VTRRGIVVITAVLASVLVAATPVQAEDPSVLSVLVTDAVGTPLPGATVEIEDEAVTTDPYGRARIVGAPPGPVQVLHPR